MEIEKDGMVAAIEIGTTYSGYAFSLKSKFSSDPLKISTYVGWNDGFKLFCGHVYYKTPTCILLDKKKEFRHFGHEAEDQYQEICSQKLQDDFYFFRGVKKDITGVEMMVDVNGKRLPACHVFQQLINALVNVVMQELDKKIKKYTETRFKKGEITLVIPLSSNLTDTSKQFLKSCVEKAGIPSSKLLFVTAAKAAFVYCKTLLDQNPEDKVQHDTEYYVIVDLGGRDADISVLVKTNSKDCMQAKYQTTGLDCGSTSVNRRFDKFLETIIGKSQMLTSRKQYPDAFLEIEKQFEGLHKYSVCYNPYVNIHLPEAIGQLFANEKERFQSKHGTTIMLSSAKIRFPVDAFVHLFFKDTIDNITTLMNKVLTNYTCYEQNPKAVVVAMVGGFSTCEFVQKEVRRTYHKTRIIVPEKTELSVVKGAVLHGHHYWHNIEMPTELLLKYRKWSGQKGFLLVINFRFPVTKERTASQEDVTKLCDFFYKLDYDIDCRSDMTTKDLKKCLEDVSCHILANKSDKYYCFVCVIMSHGNKEGISTKDGIIPVDELVLPFKNNNAPWFIGKPKIFLIQSCRGNEPQVKQQFVPSCDVETDNAFAVRMPTDADIIKIYATTPGYLSYRRVRSNEWNGSWFIHAFLTVARKNPKSHLLEIVTAVNYELTNNPEYELNGEKCQLSMSEVMLSKLFYF